jgi:hypothetical protein
MTNGLSTDAFAFLNINHPLCAWDTYRGALVCPPNERGFISVWSAEIMRTGDPARLNRELVLEHFRLAHHNHKISRLRGIFCFLDKSSAERACSWATGPRSHFRPEYLAALHLGDADPRRDRLDANWISYAPIDEDGKILEFDWIDRYWRGEAFPGRDPIWETLIDGRATVLGTILREHAYAVIKKNFPDSLMFLELGRLAAWVGSDLGNVCGFLREDGSDVILEYYQDMRDASNPAFLKKLEELMRSGHPINSGDMAPHIAQDSFGKTMDLRPFSFRRPKLEMPYPRSKSS